MKNKKRPPLPKQLQKALDLFPEIVRKNKTEKNKKQRFADKIFGDLAKKIHKEVHSKKRVGS